ncbi:MAG: cache domain-containing protein [Rhodoplanes sp.]|jgi:methyl-accepting chemotaxis protein
MFCAAHGSQFRVTGDRLMIGDHVINSDTAAVDRVQTLVGGTATVFFGDTRISTNVRKADGSRAIGTKLAQGPAYDAVFKRGKSYRGETDILGERCFTGYDPIRHASGAVIGVLYVGLKQQEFLEVVHALQRNIVLQALAVVVVIGAAIYLVMIWQTKPLLLLPR